MELQKLSAKFFVEQPNTIRLAEFIDIFHSWIQATDGVYHDVADYSHMQAGPGIILVGPDAHVSIDETGNRRGLVYSQKADLVGSNREILRHVLRAALKNCRKLEDEPTLQGKLRFAANEAMITINDRLSGANSEASFETIKGDIEAAAAHLFGGATISLERDDDLRRRLNVHVKTAARISVAQGLENLARN